MRTSASTSIFIIAMFSASVRGIFRTAIEDGIGTIQSPNFGHEYGKRADHVWRFNMRGGKVLKLNITKLKIFYYNDNGYKQCGDFYRVSFNRVDENCTEFINGGIGADKQKYFYSTPSCSEVECGYGCSKLKVDRYVDVEYYASGMKPIPRLTPSTMWGFRMTYEYLHCTTATTTTLMPRTRATTTTPPKAASSSTNALSRSTTMSTSTTNRATQSKSVTNAATYPSKAGSSSPFETTPQSQSSVTVTSVNEIKGDEGSSNAFIYGSIGGGIVFVIFLLAAVFSSVRTEKKTRGNSNAGNNEVNVPTSTTYMNITSHTSHTVYHEIEASLQPQISRGSYKISSSAKPEAAMTLIETPGYQTESFNSSQAIDPQCASVAASPPQTSRESHNISSSATAQVAMTLIETPGYQTVTFNSSQAIDPQCAYDAGSPPQTSRGGFNVSSSATAQVAMNLIETPGYQTVTFNSGQAVGSQPETHAYDL